MVHHNGKQNAAASAAAVGVRTCCTDQDTPLPASAAAELALAGQVQHDIAEHNKVPYLCQ